MFLLSCGRESVEACNVDARDTPPRASYETFVQKKASAKELRQHHAKFKNEDIWSLSASDEIDDELLPLPRPATLVARWPAAFTKANERHNSNSTTTTTATFHTNAYDSSVAAQVRPLHTDTPTTSQALEPALWALAPPPGDFKPLGTRASSSTATPTTSSSDEMAIPDLHVGLYQSFCPPQHWSPAFAAPGDFTIKMASVSQRDGDTSIQIAVICACIRAIRDSVRSVGKSDATKRKSFVKHVRRTQCDLVRFTESMALRYIGHRLVDKLPHPPTSLLVCNQRALDDYGEDVILFLSYVLGIRATGFHLLVPLSEDAPVVQNLLVREFLDLSFGFGATGDPTQMATTSCDARVERPDVRPLLPSAWLDVDARSGTGTTGGGGGNDTTTTMTTTTTNHSKSCYFHTSPRSGALCVVHTNAEDPIARSQSDGRRSLPAAAAAATARTLTPAASKCTQYVPPTQFFADRLFADSDFDSRSAFTVEISSVSIAGGFASYTITVLTSSAVDSSGSDSALATTSVERRFNDFVALASTIDAKIASLHVRRHLPPKTLFRYLSARFLEQRAAQLQTFLETLLRIHLMGILEQDIALIAEPNVRQFLELPSVEWSLVPWSKDAAATAAAAAMAARKRRASEWRRHQLTYPPSPTVGDQTVDSTTMPSLFSPSMRLHLHQQQQQHYPHGLRGSAFDTDSMLSPRPNAIKRRSDSM